MSFRKPGLECHRLFKFASSFQLLIQAGRGSFRLQLDGGAHLRRFKLTESARGVAIVQARNALLPAFIGLLLLAPSKFQGMCQVRFALRLVLSYQHLPERVTGAEIMATTPASSDAVRRPPPTSLARRASECAAGGLPGISGSGGLPCAAPQRRPSIPNLS